MIHAVRLPGALAVALAALLAGATPGIAGDGRVPLPTLAKGKGDACVEPTEVMRRLHMDFLEKQRDETVRLGIRDGKYSLNGCIECHATADPNSPDPTVKTVEPFCDQCHQYAAVAPDCWSCHNPKLAEKPRRTGWPSSGDGEKKTLLGMLRARLEKGNPSQ